MSLTSETSSSLVPVTLLSGALGAGKTTLLKRLLSPENGIRVAVIENEFASMAIDDQLLAGHAETIVTLADGCICCSIGADLERTLVTLAEKREAGELNFDHVIIEGSGMADPGPIAQLFLSEAFIREHYQLDGIITLVDAVHANQQLERPVNQAQIGFADKLVITKCDQMSEVGIDALKQVLSRINRRAPIVTISHGNLALNEVLHLKGFELEEEPDHLLFTHTGHTVQHSGLQVGLRTNAESDSSSLQHQHDPRISSIVLESLYPLTLDGLSQFMNELLEEHGHQLLRYKGILDIEGAEQRLLFQGVFRLYNFDWDRPWGDQPRKSTVVFIGEHLPEDKIRNAFARATEKSLI